MFNTRRRNEIGLTNPDVRNHAGSDISSQRDILTRRKKCGAKIPCTVKWQLSARKLTVSKHTAVHAKNLADIQ
jgi:hypothetical protein